MKTIHIEGQPRSGTGKKAVRQIRSEQLVPCVIYGGPENLNLQVPKTSLKSLVYTPDFQLAEVKVGDKSYRCVLKDLQYDPVTDQLSHVDFLELVENKRITVNIPIKFTGNPQGVKDGGKMTVKMKSLKVRTLPKYLREHIEVETGHLELNKSIRVEDVKLEGFEILNSPRIPLASVALTRVLKQEETATPAAAATAVPGAVPAGPGGAAPAAAAPAAGVPAAATPAPRAKGFPSKGDKKK
ncbi:MAG TPA: 50S ribosomal protein L25 [Chitinophagaceae bacterium]|nr:50S ribosomal protein L25 [Chitinophagaceae bacterium]